MNIYSHKDMEGLFGAAISKDRMAAKVRPAKVGVEKQSGKKWQPPSEKEFNKLRDQQKIALMGMKFF